MKSFWAREKYWRKSGGKFPFRNIFGKGTARIERNGKMILLFLAFSSSIAGNLKKI